jgi:RimJ/RimL family protein N-acetyltransferase
MVLDCGICRLRPWRRGDGAALVRAADNPNVARYLRDRFPHPYTLDDARAWIEINESSDPQTHFAVTIDDVPIGGAGFILHDREERTTAEVGYWIAEPHWGRGIASAALRVLTDYAFATHGLERISSVVMHPNTASQRVLEKVGYEREGVMRRAVVKNGEIYDLMVFAKIR